jgi:hypothetical protein
MVGFTELFQVYPIEMPVVAAEALAAKVDMPIAAASKVAVQRLNIFLIFIQFLL